jgi:hypothetical protein
MESNEMMMTALFLITDQLGNTYNSRDHGVFTYALKKLHHRSEVNHFQGKRNANDDAVETTRLSESDNQMIHLPPP